MRTVEFDLPRKRWRFMFHDGGILDVVTADPLANSVSVLLGNGDGSFQAPCLYAAGPGPYAVAAADFGGAGLFDLLTGPTRGPARSRSQPSHAARSWRHSSATS